MAKVSKKKKRSEGDAGDEETLEASEKKISRQQDNVEGDMGTPASLGSWRGVGRGRGRGDGPGRGNRIEVASSRPSALRMLKSRSGRSHTVSIAIPSSIVENAQNGELKAVLVGQIARAVTIFGVDEVVIYEDRSGAPPSKDDEGWSRSMAFMTRNLQYLETPQYLRKQLLPMHADLKWVGLLNPLDAPHHVRKKEWLAYREGVVLATSAAPAPLEKGPGCWLNCGLSDPVWVGGQTIPEGVRVTVRMDESTSGEEAAYRGTAVAPHEPRTKIGLYWGYQTRPAKCLKAIFEECPFEGGYDMTIGTSERGEVLGLSRIPKFNHLLIAFGGLGGFEEVIADALSGYSANTDPASLFSRYVNICPNQQSRTIRAEEALLMTLTALSPHLPER